MTDNGRRAADVLAGARRAWSPSVADQERVRRAIDAALPATAPGRPPASVPRAAGWGPRLLVAATIAAASGAIGYFAGHRAGLRETPRITRIAPAPVAVAPSAPLAPVAANEPQPSLMPSSPITPHHGGHPARHAVESSAPAAAESLAIEVRALRNAERALRDGNSGLALAFLEELDRQVPHGQMTEERDAASTLARCARGDRPIGVNLVGEFIERYPESLYRARIEQTCAATDGPAVGH